jgi:hypothetical protein
MQFDHFMREHQRDLVRQAARRGREPDEIKRELRHASAFNGTPGLPTLPESLLLVSDAEVEAIVAEHRERRPQGPVRARRVPVCASFHRGAALRVTLAADEEDEGGTWVPLARGGSYATGPDGSSFRLDAVTLGQIIGNFRATKDRMVPIDRGHASEQPATSGSIPTAGAPALGWVLDLCMRGRDLWALLGDLSDEAREAIAAGARIAPAIHPRTKDRESGKDVGAYLSSAGLTSRP